MKISTKGRYGMHMIHYLACNEDETPIALTTMADDLSLPEAYLEQLMRKLKKAEFVNSVRGAHGGYYLSMGADEIYILDVLKCLEDEITTTECSEDGSLECDNKKGCPTRVLWRKIDDAILSALDGYTLKDLMEDGVENYRVQKVN